MMIPKNDPPRRSASVRSHSSSGSLKSFREQYKFVQTTKNKKANAATPSPSNLHLFVRAGLPFLLFSVGASLVLKSAVEGRNAERERSSGLISKSERKARLDEERDAMVEKLNKRIATVEFDNTKRIERPEEVLERRRLEREKRNRWYARTWRWVTRQS